MCLIEENDIKSFKNFNFKNKIINHKKGRYHQIRTKTEKPHQRYIDDRPESSDSSAPKITRKNLKIWKKKINQEENYYRDQVREPPVLAGSYCRHLGPKPFKLKEFENIPGKLQTKSAAAVNISFVDDTY